MRIAELVNHRIFERKWRSWVIPRACLFECPFNVKILIYNFALTQCSVSLWNGTHRACSWWVFYPWNVHYANVARRIAQDRVTLRINANDGWKKFCCLLKLKVCVCFFSLSTSSVYFRFLSWSSLLTFGRRTCLFLTMQDSWGYLWDLLVLERSWDNQWVCRVFEGFMFALLFFCKC